MRGEGSGGGKEETGAGLGKEEAEGGEGEDEEEEEEEDRGRWGKVEMSPRTRAHEQELSPPLCRLPSSHFIASDTRGHELCHVPG